MFFVSSMANIGVMYLSVINLNLEMKGFQLHEKLQQLRNCFNFKYIQVH